MSNLYSTLSWQIARARALRRDGNRCGVSRLFGGDCSAVLHVHHLTPVGDGGARYDLDNLLTVCARHHPMLESLRRALLRQDARPRCPHKHRTRESRAACEARMARQRRTQAA